MACIMSEKFMWIISRDTVLSLIECNAKKSLFNLNE